MADRSEKGNLVRGAELASAAVEVPAAEVNPASPEPANEGRNLRVKREMAAELAVLGLSRESIERILHIRPDMD